MKHVIRVTTRLVVVLSLFAFISIVTGCDNTTSAVDDENETPDAVVDVAAIPGVTAPVAGETPVTTITETDQYTGTVSWSPTDDPFDYETVYTATITLTAKSGYTMTGVTANFFTVARVDTVTHAAGSGVVIAVFPSTGFEYAIGDIGPAGGWIFYIDEAGVFDWTYLEAAPAATEWTDEPWGENVSVGEDARGTAIGTGAANTAAIVAAIGDSAAKLADDLVHNVFDDWFLPSKDELNAIWENIVYDGSGNSGVGGFASEGYWSSSETGTFSACGQSFDFGAQNANLGKESNEFRVRAVRAF